MKEPINQVVRVVSGSSLCPGIRLKFLNRVPRGKTPGMVMIALHLVHWTFTAPTNFPFGLSRP